MLRLVSTNDHPRPSILDERHEAEWLQRFLDDEQAEANSIAAFVGDRIRTFAVGTVAGIFLCLVSEIALFYAKGVLW